MITISLFDNVELSVMSTAGLQRELEQTKKGQDLVQQHRHLIEQELGERERGEATGKPLGF